MKFKIALFGLLINASAALAQSADPVIMKINGTPVLRSEFEYSYNKNNSFLFEFTVKVFPHAHVTLVSVYSG
jgi:hypothetical protein